MIWTRVVWKDGRIKPFEQLQRSDLKVVLLSTVSGNWTTFEMFEIVCSLKDSNPLGQSAFPRPLCPLVQSFFGTASPAQPIGQQPPSKIRCFMIVPIFDTLVARTDGLGMPLAIICLLATGYRRWKQTRENLGAWPRSAQETSVVSHIQVIPDRHGGESSSNNFGQLPQTPSAQWNVSSK